MRNYINLFFKQVLPHPAISQVSFWVLFIFNDTSAQLRSEPNYAWMDFFNSLFCYTFFIVPTYIHAYWLKPRFLREKQYYLYIVLTAITICLFAFLYVKFRTCYQSDLWAFVHAVLGEIIIILTFSGWQSFVEYAKQREKEMKIQKIQTQNQLQHLKGQINPHFLFNTMNSFYALSVQKSADLPNMILQYSDLLRYSLYETELPWVCLDKEIAFLDHYIALEKIRLEKHSDVSFEVDGLIQSQQIAPLLFITFVENAFKHWGTNKANKAYIHIYLKADKEQIYFEIENTADANAEKCSSQGGIGLNNVRKRLELLYPNEHTLTIESVAGDYYRVKLTVR